MFLTCNSLFCSPSSLEHINSLFPYRLISYARNSQEINDSGIKYYLLVDFLPAMVIYMRQLLELSLDEFFDFIKNALIRALNASIQIFLLA